MRQTCKPCQVFWNGDDPCWCCGAEGEFTMVWATPAAGAHTYNPETARVIVAGQYVPAD